MLENSFIFLPSFGPTREKKLWKSGIMTWDDFLSRFGSSPFHKDSCSLVARSKVALENLDGHHFGNILPSSETWRCFPHYKKVAYLDIETTGCCARDYITVIGVYDGSKTKSYVKGRNLHEFKDDIRKFDAVATFNGSLFDLPFIRREMSIPLPPIHVDLRFLLQSLDVRGGLKKIEEQFGMERQDDLKGLTGYDAVKMWREYKKKDSEEALDRLIRYNAADVCNLEVLLKWGYREKRKRIGFDEINHSSTGS